MKKIFIVIFFICWGLLAADIVINESFNNTTLPAGWTQQYVTGNISWMTYTGGHNGNPSAPHSGARNAYIYADTCATKLITPMLNIGGSNSATLSFWHAQVVWMGGQDILRVYYKTEPSGNWILIQTYSNNLTAWTHETLNLSNESSSYYIAFEAVCGWGHGVVLDDVVIEGDPSPVGVVEGHVYNANGIPLTGAEVLIEDVNMSGLTAPGGFYQIVAVPQGPHPFFASLDGYGFDMTTATIIAGQTITVDFHLQEYIEIMVSGTVVTASGGTPVQGATITLEGFADYQAQTAANGQFIIPGVYSSNTYDLTITKPNHNPYYDTITIGTTNYNCGTISIFAPVDITGFVNTTATPGTGLSGANVTLTGYATHSVQTAANGQFLIENVYANENYDLVVSYPNHNPYEDFIEVDGEDIALGTLTLISPVSLSGHIVTNIDPGTGIEGANVVLTGYATHSTTSDDVGNFLIESIYANEIYQISISYTNHHVYTQFINIEQVSIDLGTIVLVAPVDITGWVNTTADPETGLGNAQVSLTGYETHNVQTAANGQFLITQVYALEDYNLAVSYANHNPYQATVEVLEADIDLGTLTLISPVDVSGHIVSNHDPETGLENADIDLTGYAFHTTSSDSLGDFLIDNIYANENYQITINYPNHNSYTQAVDINAVDIDLGTITMIGPVIVSGYVFGSDDLFNGLPDAEVELEGNNDYSTVSDSMGYYEFPEVFANQDYTISVDAEGYNYYEAEVDVNSTNLVLGDIIVDETTVPAGNVHAEFYGENSTVINWNSPGSSSTYEFRYDDGVQHDEIGLNATRAVIGAVHHYYSVIEQVQWYLTSAHTHPQLRIYIFGLNYYGQPDSDQLLYQSALINNVNNQWRTHNLPNPVVAPNGFLVGICTPSHWTDLAMDNGDGAPWIFQAGTQYSITDYQTGTWSDISAYPDAGNLLLRAYGINLGPPLNRDLEGYKLYRMQHDDFQHPEDWEVVAENLQDTTYTDTTWWYLDEGEWYYSIRCQHTNGIESISSFSNPLDKDAPPEYVVNLYITNPEGQPLQYAITSLTSFYHIYHSNSDAQGLADYLHVNPGVYNLHINRTGYMNYDLYDLLIVDNMDMDITLLNTAGDENELTPITSLTGIYPNPFNPETEIFFDLQTDTHVTLEVYNAKGQKTASLIDEFMTAGSHSCHWNAVDQASGIYFFKFNAGNITQLRKAVLLK